MAKSKIYKKGVRYVSQKQGFGLTLGGVRNSGWSTDFYVVESSLDRSRSKIVNKGTITECRDYMKRRFGKK